MEKSSQLLIEYLDSLDMTAWGIGNIEGLHEDAKEYPKALSMIQEFAKTPKKYDVDEYMFLLSSAHIKIEREIEKLVEFLKEHNINFKELDGSDYFSYTMAGAQAGLGWIGKSSLLVTKEYGPRIALETILIDCDIPCAKPVLESQCGNCSACVKVCPTSCIKNVLWSPGMNAMQLRDGVICEDKGYACGACMMICPQGKKGKN